MAVLFRLHGLLVEDTATCVSVKIEGAWSTFGAVLKGMEVEGLPSFRLLSVQEGNFVAVCIGTDCRALAPALAANSFATCAITRT